MEINKECQTALSQLGEEEKFDSNSFKYFVDSSAQILIGKQKTDSIKRMFLSI